MEHFDLGHGNFLAYEYIDRAKATPVVFLNGVLMNLRMWNAQVEVFSSEHPCLVHDFRGQLNSSKNLPKELQLQLHVDDTLALLDHLGISKCHIIGTSYGGEVGLLMASMAPDRLASLTVVASVSYSGALLQRQVKLWRDLATVDAGLLYDAVIASSYATSFLRRHDTFLQMRRESFQSLPTPFLQAFAQLCDAFLAFKLPSSALELIKTPTLVVSAGQDILKPPRYSEYLVSCLQDASYECIEGAGHAVVVEQPKALNRILRSFIQI